MNLNALWSTLMESVAPLSYVALDKALAELNLEPGDMTWLWAIALFDEEPFSTAAYMRIRPYGSARVNETRFASAVERDPATRAGWDPSSRTGWSLLRNIQEYSPRPFCSAHDPSRQTAWEMSERLHG